MEPLLYSAMSCCKPIVIHLFLQNTLSWATSQWLKAATLRWGRCTTTDCVNPAFEQHMEVWRKQCMSGVYSVYSVYIYTLCTLLCILKTFRKEPNLEPSKKEKALPTGVNATQHIVLIRTQEVDSTYWNISKFAKPSIQIAGPKKHSTQLC